MALVLLVLVATGVNRFAQLGQARAISTASARALVQLLAVGAVIAVILRTPASVPASRLARGLVNAAT